MDEARSVWEKTYRIAPSNLGLCLALVDIYETLGQPRKALEVLIGAKKFFASNLEVRGRLARCFLETKSFRQAKSELKEILTFPGTGPDDIPHFLAGLLFARRVKDAQRLIKRYVAGRGETPEILFYEVLVHTLRKDGLRFPIPWQKLLTTAPDTLTDRIEYLRLVLTPDDLTFLTSQIEASSRFFVSHADLHRKLASFMQKLSSLPGAGDATEPKRLVVEEG
jgi:hypothetical protein